MSSYSIFLHIEQSPLVDPEIKCTYEKTISNSTNLSVDFITKYANKKSDFGDRNHK